MVVIVLREKCETNSEEKRNARRGYEVTAESKCPKEAIRITILKHESLLRAAAMSSICVSRPAPGGGDPMY